MKKIVYSILAISVMFTACKYEEGKGVSLRSKRDRISNEWLIDNYTYTPKDSSAADRTNLYNNVNITIDPLRSAAFGATSATMNYVFVVNRTGSYNMEILDSSMNSVDPTKMWYYVDNNQPTQLVDPLSIHQIGRRGEWSFVSKHNRLQLKPDNGGSNYDANGILTGKNVPVTYDIIMLANDNVKLKATDANEGVHEYSLKPLLKDEKYIITRSQSKD